MIINVFDYNILLRLFKRLQPDKNFDNLLNQQCQNLILNIVIKFLGEINIS